MRGRACLKRRCWIRNEYLCFGANFHCYAPLGGAEVREGHVCPAEARNMEHRHCKNSHGPERLKRQEHGAHILPPGGQPGLCPYRLTELFALFTADRGEELQLVT